MTFCVTDWLERPVRSRSLLRLVLTHLRSSLCCPELRHPLLLTHALFGCDSIVWITRLSTIFRLLYILCLLSIGYSWLACDLLSVCVCGCVCACECWTHWGTLIIYSKWGIDTWQLEWYSIQNSFLLLPKLQRFLLPTHMLFGMLCEFIVWIAHVRSAFGCSVLFSVVCRLLWACVCNFSLLCGLWVMFGC